MRIVSMATRNGAVPVLNPFVSQGESLSPLLRHAALRAAITIRLSTLWREVISLASCRAPCRLSRVVATTLLSEVAEIVALPDLRSEVPEDRVRNRDVEEEVGQYQVPDVVVAAEPPAHHRRRQLVSVGLRAGNLVRLHVLQEAASLKEPSLQGRIHHAGVTGRRRIVLHQLRHVRFDLVAADGG